MSNNNGTELATALLSMPNSPWKQVFTYNHFSMLVAEPDEDGNYVHDGLSAISIEPPNMHVVEVGRNPLDVLRDRLIAKGYEAMVDVLCKNPNPQDGLVYVPIKTIASIPLDAVEVKDTRLLFRTGELIWSLDKLIVDKSKDSAIV